MLRMPAGFIRYLSAAWLAWILLAATKRLIRFFPPPDAPLNGDAYWTYLPNARKLLEQPWAFLTTDPNSYHVAPLGYVWAAIWGADPERIQLANCVLFLACVLLLWRCSTRLGGFLAGVVATSLLAYHPELTTYVPQVLTESIYLFGLVVCMTALVEYVLSDRHPRLLLGLAATGLTITLLSRPVLQAFVLAAFAMALAATGYFAWRRPAPGSALAGWSRIINRRLCLALLVALLLPTTVTVKNGLCFGVWGLGTGAGSGLYYGVSPFKMGLEPVYSGFNYDAGITPLTAAPETKGNPLTLASDRINARVALDIIKNTTLQDNAAFFFHKFKAWLFYSTPELHISHKLRSFRSFEWLTIGIAGLTLAMRSMNRSSANPGLRLPGLPGRESEKLAILLMLLLLVLGMALQLTPVLYNTRYNIFFMEPWLMLLCGVCAAIVLQQAAPRQSTQLNSRLLTCLLSKTVLVLLLALLPPALTRHALRHETWGMDPYRPGPTAVVLDGTSMASVHAVNATALEDGRWRLDTSPATLTVPLQIDAPEMLAPNHVLDAIWRIRFGVTTADVPRACRKAILAVSHSHTPQDWYEPEPALTLHVDGQMHTYAIHGNDQLRPLGNGELSITFTCPPGTIVTWVGAELLRSTLPEAARALIQRGEAIDPYRHNEPH